MTNGRFIGIRRLLSALLILVLGLGGGDVAPPAARGDDAQLRRDVLQAIDLAQKYVVSQQQNDGSFGSIQGGRWTAGVAALATLALINSGKPIDDPVVSRGLEYLRRMPEPTEIYDIAMTIQALVAARTPKRDTARIAQFAERLEQAQNSRNQPGAGARSSSPETSASSESLTADLRRARRDHASTRCVGS